MDPSGRNGIGNLGNGLQITDSSDNAVGGSTAHTGNVISFNLGSGVFVHGPATTDNKIMGNVIGLDPAGSYKLSNGGDGACIQNVSKNNIGGSTAGAGNVISGNYGSGIHIASVRGDFVPAGNRVYGNLIGLLRNGAQAAPNG